MWPCPYARPRANNQGYIRGDSVSCVISADMKTVLSYNQGLCIIVRTIATHTCKLHVLHETDDGISSRDRRWHQTKQSMASVHETDDGIRRHSRWHQFTRQTMASDETDDGIRRNRRWHHFTRQTMVSDETDDGISSRDRRWHQFTRPTMASVVNVSTNIVA